jgi:uncharacterized lipoprotein YddW (UPF0748 family)
MAGASSSRRRSLLLAGLSGLSVAGLSACDSLPPAAAAPIRPPPPPAEIPPEYRAELPPPAPREFRGAWVATVANIDWPSKPGLSAATLRKEALAILNRAQQVGLNALVLQVRPACDAIYPSTLEPWTEYLSGEQGKPPIAAGEAAWDPLAFWVAEAHKRGLELHAWLNPYRARHSSAKSQPAATHISQRRPDLVKTYGDMQWMDPGEAEAAMHTLAVVADVVRRYDIDGLHIDDYFYPYPVTTTPAVPATATAAAIPAGPEVPFPDDEGYARYRLGGGALGREDWRRANVDSLVEAIYRAVHLIKPWVRFGVSPFGVGKPELRPPGVIGFSQYDKLYADAERWLAQGWLDYLAPQLYWPIAREGLQFPVLLDYWLQQNTASRHVWPGLFTSQTINPNVRSLLMWPGREIFEQIALQRSRPAATGHIHFSMVALMQDRDSLATLLQAWSYAQAALVPETTWLNGPPPPTPQVRIVGEQVLIDAPASSTPSASDALNRWAVWRREDGVWRLSVLSGSLRRFELGKATAVVVQAVDRTGQLSERVLLKRP